MRAARLAFAAACLLILALPDAAPAGTGHGLRLRGERLGTSTNWAGYAIETSLASPARGAVSDVKGSWIVPAVDCSATGGVSAYSASWVGIDGYSSNSVEQTGTESDCLNNGATPYYAAWWEMYPKGSRRIGMTIHPGDQMRAEVRWTGSAFVLTLADATTGATFTTTQRAKADRSSAEWVVEAPWSGGVLPLADFGSTSMTGASATVNGHTGAISDAAWQADGIQMVNGAGQTKAATGPLDATGASFTVSWLRAS